jgi:hypothetical protein
MTQRAVRARERDRSRGRRLHAEFLEERLALSSEPLSVGGELSSTFQLNYPAALSHPDPAVRAAMAGITTTAPADEFFFIVDPLTGVPKLSLEDGIPSGTALELIGLEEYRNDVRFAGIDGSGYSVVILDTGMDLDHPFFGPDSNGDGVADRVIYNADFVDGAPNANDLNGHGTHVTSILASEDVTFDGIAPGVNIIHLRVLDNAGSGSAEALEAALQWVVANVNIYEIVSVNMSLSFGDNQSSPVLRPELGLNDELAALAAQNVIVSAASGNLFFPFQSAPGVSYPSADPSVLSVGATWASTADGPVTWGSGANDFTTGPDRIVSFSQRHPTMTNVFAPGAAILAAAPGGGTALLSGTSMSAPVITGVAALMQQLSLQLTGSRLSLAEFAELIDVTGVPIFDGDNEDDNVVNTQAEYHRVDLMAIANAVLSNGLTDLTLPNDLELGSPSVPAGGTARLDFTIANQGATASGSFTSKIYLSADSTIDSSDVLLAQLTDELAPGEAVTRTQFAVPVPAGAAFGDYFIGVVVDSESGVTESSEVNNMAALPLAVTESSGEILLTDAATGAVILDGVTTVDFGQATQGLANVEKTFRIQNDGNVDLVLSPIALPAGFAVTGFPTSVAPGASAEFTIALVAANAAAEYVGEATFEANDADENPFNFTLSGTVVEPDDHGDDAAHATEVSGFSTIEGVIFPIGDLDWFRFSAVEGVQFHFETILDALGDSVLRLFDVDGTTVLATNDDGPDGPASVIDWVAPADGEYFLEVSGAAASEGSYKLVLAAEDDNGNDAATATPTSDPSFTFGVLETRGDPSDPGAPGDRDWFSFVAVEGVTYRFWTTLETLTDSRLWVYDRDGINPLVFNDDGPATKASFIRWKAPKNGTYYVVVDAADPSLVGKYGLQIESNGDDYGDNAANAWPVTTPILIGGDINEPFDVDWFSFNATAGVTYRVATALNSLTDSILRLFDVDGTTQLAMDDDGGVGATSLIEWTAPADGKYFVEVSGVEWRTGSYHLSITAGDDHGNNANTATDTSEPSLNIGFIEVAEDVDWFSFDALEGVTYRAETILGALPGSAIRIINFNGHQEIANSTNGPGAPSVVEWTAPRTGKNYIEVKAATITGVGDYQLRITGEDDHGDNPQNASPLPVPGNIQGSIERPGDRDWFRFTSSAGIEYRFDLVLGTLGAGTILLLEADGVTEVAVGGGAGPGFIEWTAPGNATYYVEISGFELGGASTTPTQAGSYEIISTVTGFLAGDYDFDADVDGHDFLTWQRGVGSTTELAADGDASGIVDGADLTIWKDSFGLVFTGPATTDGVAVAAPLVSIAGGERAPTAVAVATSVSQESLQLPWLAAWRVHANALPSTAADGERTEASVGYDGGAAFVEREHTLRRVWTDLAAMSNDDSASESDGSLRVDRASAAAEFPRPLSEAEIDAALADLFGGF